MTARSQQFGPVYKERIGMIESVIVSDPHEYSKVVQVDGKYPHRIELFPMVHFRKQKKMPLGTVNS
jgi:cytochrome P450 family 49 subfamily A